MKTYRIDRTARVLGFILDAARKHRVLTIRDLCKKMGTSSTNGVHFQLFALKRDGLITWEPGKARTIRPTCRFISAEELLP